MTFVPTLARCVTAGEGNRMDGESCTFVPCVTGQRTHALRAEGFDASEDGTGRGTPIVPAFAFDQVQITHPENRSQPTPGAPCHTLAKDNAARAALAFHTLQDPISGPVSPALDRKQSGMGLLSVQGGRWLVRRLTPMECERLQGFPEGYTAIPDAADGPRYAALGNSMAVPVMRWIGERIDFVDRLQRTLQQAA